MKNPEQLTGENIAKFMEHGAGLRKDYNVWIGARDRTKNASLVCGLGGMGIGQMWVDNSVSDHSEYPGYEEAPELECHKFGIAFYPEISGISLGERRK